MAILPDNAWHSRLASTASSLDRTTGSGAPPSSGVALVVVAVPIKNDDSATLPGAAACLLASRWVKRNPS